MGPTADFHYITWISAASPSAVRARHSRTPIKNAESIRTSAGWKLSYHWKWPGLLIRPGVRAAWQHEFGDTAYPLASHFAQTGGSSFTVTGPDLGRERAPIGAGFAVQCSGRVSTYLYYGGEFGPARGLCVAKKREGGLLPGGDSLVTIAQRKSRPPGTTNEKS